MNVLGLITARGGSKGIPGKNLAPCGGRPLLAWTCDAARGASCLTRTVISTDDSAIADVARNLGIEAPFLRPAELASDTARSIDVAHHAMQWLADHEHWQTEIVVLLQPTSPLRTSRHVDEAFERLDVATDTVVSVMLVPHHFAPWSLMMLDDERLKDYQLGDLPFDRYRRQGQPRLYARNGPAVIATRVARMSRSSFYGERIAPYEMSSIDSIDIDDANDLELADLVLRQRSTRQSPTDL